MKMVAERAGLSVATVSKYFGGGNVIPENRVKVQAAADELDYRMDEIARSLKTRKSRTVGVLASSITSIFVTSLISSIQARLMESGYNTIIGDYREEPKLESVVLDALVQRRVDGVILFPETDEVLLVEVLRSRGIPVVCMNLPPQDMNTDSVVCSNAEGAFDAVDALLEAGHRKIGVIVGPQTMYSARERKRGALEAFGSHGVTPREFWIQCGPYSSRAGYDCCASMFESPEPPTAIFSGDYYSTIGALTYLAEHSIQVPRDVSFVTFDTTEYASVVGGGLSMIEQPLEAMGERAASLLLRRMNGDWAGFPTIDSLETTVSLGGSIRALDDPS